VIEPDILEVLAVMQYPRVPKTGTNPPVFITASTLCLVAASAFASEPPASFQLSGVVRDFPRSHPDFNPAASYGHNAGNVEYFIGPGHRPVFSGNGFRVDAQWRDAESRPIAPHLFGGWGAGAVLVANAPTITGLVTLDTWDSTLGPYGGANVGPAPNVVEGASMPTIAPPAGMGASVGNLDYEDVGTSVLSANVRCDSLSIRDDHRLQISGDVTVLCDGAFEMRDGGVIELLPGASMELYVVGDVEIVDSTINDGFYDPTRFVIYHLGAGQVRLGDGADMYGTIVSPAGRVVIDNDANFYGALTTADLLVTNTAGLHIDQRSQFDQCGNRFADVAGTAGPTSTAGITSAGTFSQWYRDVPGVNLSTRHAITLVRDVDNVYEYAASPDFFPIDDDLLGNEGDPHNYYFTYAINAQFTYDACSDQFFEFEGSDDAWVFVDGTLAMDLGGIAPGTEQIIDFDRLGLLDGEVASLVFLYAHRKGPFSGFRIRTNVVLTTEATLVVSAGFD
jgi:fibro-slime domain-containing protein